jgi:hypothetical protein
MKLTRQNTARRPRELRRQYWRRLNCLGFLSAELVPSSIAQNLGL